MMMTAAGGWHPGHHRRRCRWLPSICSFARGSCETEVVVMVIAMLVEEQEEGERS